MDRDRTAVCLSVVSGAIAGATTVFLLYQQFFDLNSLTGHLIGSAVLGLSALIFLVTTLHLYPANPRWGYGAATLTGTLFLLLVISFGYKSLRDASPVWLWAEYYADRGFELILRRDGTVKATERNVFDSSDQYGTYRLSEDTVVLNGITLRYRGGPIDDTLMIRSTHLVFTIDKHSAGGLRDSMPILRDYRR